MNGKIEYTISPGGKKSDGNICWVYFSFDFPTDKR